MAGRKGKLAFAAALLGAVALSAAPTAQSHAASRACRQLEAELASASRGGNPAYVRKYDQAIARQSQQIVNTRSQARRAGCGFSLFGGNVGQCAALNATIERMSDNLDDLQRKRAQLAGGGSRRDRSRIMAALDANGCRGGTAKRLPDRETAGNKPPARPAEDVARQRGSSRQSSGTYLERNANRIIVRRDASGASPNGEYRTLCVRTCDGYFFPMSNAASLGDFERDQKNCESSCPGTEMQVFYTSGVADNSATMTSSVTGRPYSELPTAYLYKQPNTASPQGCGCNASQNFEVIAGTPASRGDRPATAQDASSFVSLPAGKPDAAAARREANPETTRRDPETTRRPAPRPDAPAPAAPGGERKVRVVGPVFLPDREGAKAPQAPAPNRAR